MIRANCPHLLLVAVSEAKLLGCEGLEMSLSARSDGEVGHRVQAAQLPTGLAAIPPLLTEPCPHAWHRVNKGTGTLSQAIQPWQRDGGRSWVCCRSAIWRQSVAVTLGASPRQTPNPAVVSANAVPHGENQKVPVCPQHPSSSSLSNVAGLLPEVWPFISLINHSAGCTLSFHECVGC